MTGGQRDPMDKSRGLPLDGGACPPTSPKVRDLGFHEAICDRLAGGGYPAPQRGGGAWHRMLLGLVGTAKP